MHHYQNALVHGNGSSTALQVTKVGPSLFNLPYWSMQKNATTHATNHLDGQSFGFNQCISSCIGTKTLVVP